MSGEDVSKFLMQVKELGDRRAEEDEARSRGLEERILQDRKERQARRQERARSISPQKSSPATTPPRSTHRSSVTSDRVDARTGTKVDPPSTTSSATIDTMPRASAADSTSSSRENEAPFEAGRNQASRAMSPTRTNSTARGLSWQKRPDSQISNGLRNRPLTVMATENAARSSHTAPETTSSTEPARRDSVAEALSSQDPVGSRQTTDRGVSSGPYRKKDVEDEETWDISSMRAQLPDMTSGQSHEPHKESINHGAGSVGYRPASASGRPGSVGMPKPLGSPLSLTSAQRLDPPMKYDGVEDEPTQRRSPTMSTGRMSLTRTDRPTSPTKGLGGFVESAMMKRSDSVNKRWSVQSGTGLQRADTTSSNRNSPIQRTATGTKSRPTSMHRVQAGESLSRPGSSHSATKDDDGLDKELISSKISASLGLDSSSASLSKDRDIDQVTPPTSPPKTMAMDQRRWSPPKTSWLDSALNKPESPKSKPNPAPSNQPAWMAELAKAKAQKAAIFNTGHAKVPSVSHKPAVSIGGLMRSTAPGTVTKPASSTGPDVPATDNRTSYGSVRSRAESSAGADSSSAEPAATSKAVTPPKLDFRANLKARLPPPSSGGASGNNELKAVFGTLRKAKVENFVAPDELKNNILRGKAGLTQTGGPRKSEHKDEFKEAILAKQQEFQKAQRGGRGFSRQNSTASEKSLPEGLAKKLELGQTASIRPISTASSASDQSKRMSTPLTTPSGPEEAEPVSAADAANGQTDRPDMMKRISAHGKSSQQAAAPTHRTDTVAPGRLPGKLNGSALANRFNPALAGILARGPPAASGSTTAAGAASSERNTEGAGDSKEPGPTLHHLTKGRARGPKRKVPSTTALPALDPTPASESAPNSSTVNADDIEIRARPSDSEISQGAGTETKVVSAMARTLQGGSVSSTQSKDDLPRARPLSMSLLQGNKKIEDTVEPASPRKAHGRSPSKIDEQVAAFAAFSNPSSPTKRDEPETHISPPSSPKKLNMQRVSRYLDDAKLGVAKGPETREDEVASSSEAPKVSKPEPAPSVSANATTPVVAENSGSPLSPVRWQRAQASPRKEQLEETVGPAVPHTVKKGAALFGGRPLPVIAPPDQESAPPKSWSRRLPVRASSPSRPLPSPPQDEANPNSRSRVKTPPTALKSIGRERPSSPPTSVSPMRSPTKQHVDITNVLNDFFGPMRPKRDYRTDTAQLLMNRPSQRAPDIRTLGAQLFQFSAEGKKVAVPAHRERVLFESEMYLCSHTFQNEVGNKTCEVYFWVGGEVPIAVAEQAAVFVIREAKAMGGKLVKMTQGKETAEFLAALGGIMITRRGWSNKYDSLAPHMLCGRRYHGQIVFDQVDFTPASLCSGFPFVVTSGGRCYLWKGKGSGVDELSCARLIGMDHALSGDMEEMEDGREPGTFWDLFDGGSKPASADHWRLKPNYDKYCSRLFSSDAGSAQQIIEISPFSQSDLEPTGIYVLDAFFELYIIVGKQAQAHYASFHNALEFAQEYAIIAASMDDRPFMPISTVVLEGIPRDMKSVFRKWRDADSPTITNAPGGGTGLTRGRSLRVVPLTQALQALRD